MHTPPSTYLSEPDLKILHDLVDGSNRDAPAIMRDHQLTATQLTDWLRSPEHRHHLLAHCGVNDWQAQSTLSRFRPAIVARLIRIAMGEGIDAETSPAKIESMRKACVNILQLNLAYHTPPLPDEDSSTSTRPDPALNDPDGLGYALQTLANVMTTPGDQQATQEDQQSTQDDQLSTQDDQQSTDNTQRTMSKSTPEPDQSHL